MGLPLALAILIGGLLLGQLWARRTRPIWRFGTARPGMVLGALVALVGAMVVGVRGEWIPAIGLLALAAGLGAAARGGLLRPPSARPPKSPALSEAEAAALLGVTPDASPEAVNAAYRRLIALAHPDRGGTHGLAAQLNAARAVLLRRTG